jgi:hypothetical protein
MKKLLLITMLLGTTNVWAQNLSPTLDPNEAASREIERLNKTPLPQGQYNSSVPGGNVFIFCKGGRPSKLNPMRPIYDSTCPAGNGSNIAPPVLPNSIDPQTGKQIQIPLQPYNGASSTQIKLNPVQETPAVVRDGVVVGGTGNMILTASQQAAINANSSTNVNASQSRMKSDLAKNMQALQQKEDQINNANMPKNLVVTTPSGTIAQSVASIVPTRARNLNVDISTTSNGGSGSVSIQQQQEQIKMINSIPNLSANQRLSLINSVKSGKELSPAVISQYNQTINNRSNSAGAFK